MLKYYKSLPPKLKLSLPIVGGIIISVVIITILSVNNLQNTIYSTIERNLTTEVKTLKKMFEREYALKLDKVKRDLNIIHNEFYNGDFRISNETINIEVINQINKSSHKAKIFRWYYNDVEIYDDIKFVDHIHNLVGGTITIFQKIDSGYVRISTNVLKLDSNRAVRTFIPNSSIVAKTIETGETYVGRAFVVNDWYITAYEPIYQDDKIVGMLYAGDKEKDLDELRSKLMEITIGKSGFPFVLNAEGQFLIHPELEGAKSENVSFINSVLEQKEGIVAYPESKSSKNRIAAFEYFEDFDLYIAAVISLKDETQKLVWDIIINSIVIGLVIIIAFSIFVNFISAENVRRFLSQLEDSSKKLETTKAALKQSEGHFYTLFNSIGDSIFVIDFSGKILEVNQAATDLLEYTRDEFLSMNFRELKSNKFLENVDKNISMITKIGRYQYESENRTKSGKAIPVEMNSRVVEYKNERAIMAIAHDITERKEVEERILTTIIQTEENERKRFAADLHDDLGPILSTVKLYTDLLKKKKYKKINEDEAVKNIEELVDMAITSTREISRNIRSNILQDFGLADAINDFCQYINNTKSININVNTHDYQISKRGIEETILYQAVKELINNTLRHAGAQNIKIELKSHGNQIILYYRDDGNGFDLNQALKENSGLGLNNIINKIKSIKGAVDINSEVGKGMFIIASLKIRDKKE
jgi:PAS domain S-box-containing protein